MWAVMANQETVPFVVKSQNMTVIEDTYLLAALLTFAPGLSYVPRRNADGRISFLVTGRIADEMGRLYAGEAAPLKDYIANLKALRAKIFALKGAGRPVEKVDPAAVGS
jgi:hypothetical protein